MKPKVCILTYGKLTEILSKEIVEFLPRADIKVYEILLSNVTVLPKEIQDADVYVSSGYNASILNTLVNKPVITMQPSISDILLCIEKAYSYCENPLVACFGAPNEMLLGFKETFNWKIIVNAFSSPDDIPKIIEEYKACGGQCVIGTALVCSAAEKAGLPTVYMHPAESVKSNLEIAVETAVSLRAEANKSRQFAAVIENSNSGILMVDTQGKITMCNPKAANYLKEAEKEIYGRQLYDVLPLSHLGPIANLSGNYLNQICQVSDMQLVVNIVCITIKGELSSVLVSFDDVAHIKNAESRITQATKERGFIARHRFEDYETKDEIFRIIIDRARRFSLLDDIVAIYGETGTGKELIAQSIHNNSKRFRSPFVPVNCSAITENLLESELFGYEDGAFTGARRGGKEGLFEMANHGTIFLDEIGDISKQIQTKLLRVIQEKQIMRVGGTRLIPIDVRIIVATNKDLWDLAQKGEFREDLYYRINVLELNMPPLRDRHEDILPLFLSFFNNRFNKPDFFDKQINQLSKLLCSYAWPGNVRELENFTLMVCAMIDRDDDVSKVLNIVEDMIDYRNKRRCQNISPGNPQALPPQSNERQHIISALKDNGWNQTAAAAELGISRVTLWRKMKDMEISRANEG